MRFSFISLPIEFYSPITGGAIATIIHEVATELEKDGHEVQVFSANNSEEWFSAGQITPLLYASKSDMTWLRSKWSGLQRRLNRWDWPGYDSYLTTLKTAVRRKCTPQDNVIVFNDFVTQRYIKKLLPDAAIFSWLQNEWRTHASNVYSADKTTTKFLTCSDYIARWTSNYHNLSRDRFTVVESGVNLTQFTPNSVTEPLSKSLRVLCVGRLDRNKGPDIALDAVRRLQAEGCDITFTLAGATWFYGDRDDSYSRQLKFDVQRAGGRCLGHVGREQIASVYREADVVCVLSRSNEPFGLVALEAMASGCAVLASNRGGLPEACGQGAVLVSPEDLSSIEDHLRQWARDREELRKAKKAALLRASRASWAVTAHKLAAIAEESCWLRK